MAESPEKRIVAPLLNRLTTVFHPGEDRIRISGQIKDEKVHVLWLTQRLVNRLVPVMTAWLEKQSKETVRNDLLQSVQQERVRRQQAEKSDDLPVPVEGAEAEWLAVTLDIQQSADLFRIIFKDKPQDAEHIVALELKPPMMRQWLNVLLVAYRSAQWPLTAWPEWMQDQIQAPAKTPSRALH